MVARTARPRSRRRRYHHGDLANALVAAGVELVEAEGAAALGLREVAKRAGVSAAAVYRHFADKEALGAAVAAEGFAALIAAFERSLARQRANAPMRRLKALGQTYIAFALAHPGLFRLMFGANRPASAEVPQLERRAEQAFRLLETSVAACHGPAAQPRAIAAAAVAAWSLVHGYVTLRLEGQLARLPAAALPEPGALLDRLFATLP